MTNPFLDEKAAAANNPFIGLDDGIEPTRPGPAVISAQERQPDAWVNAKRRGQQLGIAPEIVERNPAEVKRLELRQSLDKIRRENPSLADWLMRDDNLTVAQDDTESLSFIGRMLKASEYAVKRVPGIAGSFVGSIADISERSGDKLTLAMPQWLRGNKNLTDDVIRNERQVEPLFKLADWLKSSSPSQDGMTTFQQVKDNPLNAPTFVAEQIVASAPDMAAAVAALPAYVLARTGEIASTRAKNDNRSEIVSSDYVAALPAAILEATFERFSTSRLFKPGTGTVLRRIGTEVAVQAGTEGAEEGFSNLGETVGTRSGFNLQQFADAVGAGALVGAGLGGTIEGTKSAFEKYHAAAQARQRGQQENEQVDTLTKIVQQSKTWQRDPVKMENAIASLKGAGVENVYLPGEAVMTLYQSSPEMAQVFEAAGVSRDKVSEAILTGADLSVPMETYLTRIAPKYHGELGKYARLSPDTITESDPDATDEQTAAVERFLASVNDAPPEGDADMRVYNDVLGQLLGTYSQADAEVMASVVNAMFRDGIARRAGVDPMELYQRYGLRVVDEMKRRYPPDRVHPEFDADLERLRTGDIPTEDEALGPTIGEFLSKRGIRSAPNEPMSGEIRRLAENDRFTRAGRRRLVREDDPNALTLDYAREAAVEAGYLPEGSDINDLLDALENDARPISPANPNAHETRLRLTSLADELDRQGLDVNALSNGEIRRALMGGVATDPNMMNFDQSGDAAFTESDYRPEVVSWAREKFGEMVAPNGRPAWQNFVAWFGDSKVVDADGKPLVVYHGTALYPWEQRTQFDPGARGRFTREDRGAREGFFFAESAADASFYADRAESRSDERPHPDDQYELVKAEGVVLDVYLRANNPLVIDIKNSAGLPQEDYDNIKNNNYEALRYAQNKGYDAVLIADGDDVNTPGTWVVFRPEQIKSATGNRGTFDPSNPSILNQQRRGYLQFGADRKFTIGLTEARDLSTFMHEIGHLGLEIMSDMAATDPVFAEEFGILTRWWQENADAVIATADREVRDAINAAGGADFLRTVAADFRGDYGQAGVAAKTALHEYFARGFERYLAEGKPPTPELARPFSRFKAWLKAIYKSLVNLNVDLNDEVRGFMARMIAGDEAVAEAERASVSEPLFKEAARAGMSEAKFKAYLELQAKAHEEAEARVTAEAYREVMREREAWWREESRRVEAEVRAELEALPVYRAWEALARNREPNGTPLDTPQVKLSKDWLVDRYGHAWVKKNLLRKQVYSADGGVHGDVVAPMFGFNTGSELVEALSNALPLAKAVRIETQNRMRERYGDMRNDGTLPEKAMRAVHNSRRVKVIEAEIAALARLANEPAMTAKQARDWAIRQLAGRTVRDVVPYIYLRAERKAAREAVKAAAAGKMAEALAASRRRLANAVMYDEAAKVRERVDRLQQRVKKLAKRPAQERMAKAGGEWSEVLNSVLDAVGVRQLGPGEQRIDLSKWIDKHMQDGTPNPIPQSVEDLVTSGRVQSIKEMPVSLMDDVREAIKNITKQSNAARKVIVDGKRVEYAEQQQRVVDTLNRVLGAGNAVFSEDELGALDAILKHGGELADSILPTETLVERLDGGKSGPMHDLFWNPAMEARRRRADLRREVAMPLVQRVESWSKADRKRMREQIPMKSLGGLPLSRFQLLGMALHMGTPSSLDVLMRGGRWINGKHYEFGQPVIDEAIQNLSKEDWDLVSDIWTMMGDRLWKETVALQKRTGGIVPKRLETRDIETPYGTVKGGYFPLIAARGQSDVGRKVEESDVIGMATAGISRATTSKSRLQERTGAVYPLELNLETLLTSSIDKVITDISHREFVVQANKVLTDPKITSIINDRVHPGVVKSLLGATSHAVRMGGDFDPAMRWPDRIMNSAVTNLTSMALGFRFALGVANYGTAWPQAAARIGNGNIVKATGRLASAFVRTFGPGRFKAVEAQVHALSPYMKSRADEFESTYRDALKSLVGKQSLRAKTIRMGLSYITYVDRLSAIPIWHAAFEEQRAAGASIQDAVREADKTVRSTQTDGSDISLSAFERSGKWRMFKMFIGPMLIQGARIRDAVAKKGASYDMSYPERMGVLLAAWVVPALMFDLLAGRWPDDYDDDDDVDGKDWARWALVKVGLYPFQTTPVVRDAASVVESRALGKPVFSRNNPLSDAAIVFADAGNAAWEYAKDAIDEDEDADEAKLLKAAAKAGAIATGAPYIAADTAGQFIYDVGTGEYEPTSPTDLQYLFVRRPKEKH